MKKKKEILEEAAKCNKAANIEKENGHYMSWQQLLTREKALLWCLSMEKGEMIYGKRNNRKRN